MQRKSDSIEREEKRTFLSLDDQLSSIEQRLSWLKKLELVTEQYRATKAALAQTSIRPSTPIMIWDLTPEGIEAYETRHLGLAQKAWPPSLRFKALPPMLVQLLLLMTLLLQSRSARLRQRKEEKLLAFGEDRCS